MSQPENDEDIKDVMRVRTSREEVRRRNREIIARANAELRENKDNTISPLKPTGGKAGFSRLGLINRGRDESQTFWCDYRFHNCVPDLQVGPMHDGLKLDASKFYSFDSNSFSQSFQECMKSICLVEDASVICLDLVNPHEVYQVPTTPGLPVLDPEDEALLSNDLVSVQSPDNSTTDTYTGHFLRKPQLMSNDLFAESNLMNSSSSRVNIGSSRAKEVSSSIDDDFTLVKELDAAASTGHPILNPITRTSMRVKRSLPILPDNDLASGNYVQIKFDETLPSTDLLGKYLLDSDFVLYEAASSNLTRDDFNFPNHDDVYKRRRRFTLMNKASLNPEGCFLLRQTDSVCLIKPVGNKVLLKKLVMTGGMQVQPEEVEIRLESNRMSEN